MPSHPPSSSSCSTSLPPYATYRIGRGETGVLTYEPYKSALLPHWRFRTPALARESSSTLWQHFLDYEEANDFVGMDMTRKFLQMGMTRAKRYANHKGGKKYEQKKGEDGKEGYKRIVKVNKDEHWEGRKEKEEASQIFKEVWERAKAWEGYAVKKQEFLKKQKEWDRTQKRQLAIEAEDAGHEKNKRKTGG